MPVETRHILAGTWYCPTCKHVLNDDESLNLRCEIVRGRKISTNVTPDCGHVVRWIAPWETVPS